MASLLSVLVTLLALFSVASSLKPYRHLSFKEIAAELKRLNQTYPDLIRLETAQGRYGLAYPFCTPDPCPILIVTLTEFSTLAADRVQVFISGALHGDEILGPNIAVNLAKYLLENYGKDPWITYLLQNRVIVIVPIANAQGYYHGWREERTSAGKSFDPNRDFPYNNNPNDCMHTLAGRTLARVISDHIFVLGITFHGGDIAIGYEWGSVNHKKNGRQAEECPDDSAMSQLGSLFTKYAGEVRRHNIPPYPVGKMTDLVYAVNGGLEDWAYAASWSSEVEGKNLLSNCSSGNYGGFNASEIKVEADNVRFPLFLVETSFLKRPDDGTFGSERGILEEAGGASDGYVSRNIRLALAMIDMARPYIRDLAVKTYNSSHLEVSWKIAGALYVNATYLEWAAEVSSNSSSSHSFRPLKNGCELLDCKNFNFTHKSKMQTGLSIWLSPSSKFSAYLPRLAAVDYVFAARATVDQQWATQRTPIPKIPPVTHFTRIRTEPVYFAEHKHGGFVIASKSVHSSDIYRVSALGGDYDDSDYGSTDQKKTFYRLVLSIVTFAAGMLIIIIICCYLIRRKSAATWNQVQEVEMQNY